MLQRLEELLEGRIAFEIRRIFVTVKRLKLSLFDNPSVELANKRTDELSGQTERELEQLDGIDLRLAQCPFGRRDAPVDQNRQPFIVDRRAKGTPLAG